MKKRFRIPAMFALIALVFQGCEYKQDMVEVDAHAPAVTALKASTFLIENGKFPTAAIDSRTNKMYVSYFRNDEKGANVYLIYKNDQEDAWSAPVRVNSENEEISVHGQAPAQVVVGPEGNVYVVWTNSIPVEGRRFPASNLLFARSTDGGLTFSPQKAINTDANDVPASHTFHDMTVGPDGTVYVSWLDSRERYQTTAHNEGAVPVKHVKLGGHAQAGHLHEVGTQVWVASSSDNGATFSEGTVVARETCQCCRTSLMVAKDGTVYVAWRHIFPGTERDMALAYSTDGGKTFSEPRRIFADHWNLEGCPHSGPSLVIDAAGRFHAAWFTGEESRPGLYYTSSEDGITFEEPVPLATEVGVSQVKLSGHGQSRVWLSWEDKKAGGIQMAYSEDGGPLTLTDELMPETSAPAIAALPTLRLVVGQEKENIRIDILSQ